MTDSFLQHKSVPYRAAFFRSWLQDPFNVASVVPSSRWLARLMATDLAPGARVVELGAGTGTLTDAILARGVRPQDLFLVEQCMPFVDILRSRFPLASVLRADAAELSDHLPRLVGQVTTSSAACLSFGSQRTRRLGYSQRLSRCCARKAGSTNSRIWAGRPWGIVCLRAYI